MTKIIEKTQWRHIETNIFKCWCGENSYLDITSDNDGDLYITITQYPTNLLERFKLAFKALRGLEFSSSNSVMIVNEDINKLIKALRNNNAKAKNRTD